MIWVLLIGVIIGIVYYKSKSGSDNHSSGSLDPNSSVQNMWSDFEQTTVKRVDESWLAYLQRARQEDQVGRVIAGDVSLVSLIHNFLWCVYDLGKYANDCHGTLSIQANGETYSIRATANLSINEESKYQVLYQTMIESFFIDTPGIRLDFSDYKKDIDHEEEFPWVSKNHSKMIPTMDYYIIGMHFSISNITSLCEGLLSSLIKTPKDALEYKAKEHIKYGLSYAIYESNDSCSLNFTSHYIEPTVD